MGQTSLTSVLQNPYLQGSGPAEPGRAARAITVGTLTISAVVTGGILTSQAAYADEPGEIICDIDYGSEEIVDIVTGAQCDENSDAYEAAIDRATALQALGTRTTLVVGDDGRIYYQTGFNSDKPIRGLIVNDEGEIVLDPALVIPESVPDESVPDESALDESALDESAHRDVDAGMSSESESQTSVVTKGDPSDQQVQTRIAHPGSGKVLPVGPDALAAVPEPSASGDGQGALPVLESESELPVEGVIDDDPRSVLEFYEQVANGSVEINGVQYYVIPPAPVEDVDASGGEASAEAAIDAQPEVEAGDPEGPVVQDAGAERVEEAPAFTVSGPEVTDSQFDVDLGAGRIGGTAEGHPKPEPVETSTVPLEASNTDVRLDDPVTVGSPADSGDVVVAPPAPAAPAIPQPGRIVGNASALDGTVAAGFDLSPGEPVAVAPAVEETPSEPVFELPSLDVEPVAVEPAVTSTSSGLDLWSGEPVAVASAVEDAPSEPLLKLPSVDVELVDIELPEVAPVDIAPVEIEPFEIEPLDIEPMERISFDDLSSTQYEASPALFGGGDLPGR